MPKIIKLIRFYPFYKRQTNLMSSFMGLEMTPFAITVGACELGLIKAMVTGGDDAHGVGC